MSVVTSEDIQRMLYDDDAEPAAESTGAPVALPTPSRISSLRVIDARCSLLPVEIHRLRELNSLQIHSNQLSWLEDSSGAADEVAEEDSQPGEETEQKTSSASSTRTRSGLRDLKQLHSLELVHSASPPLSSLDLPSSLTSLMVRSYDISERFFTSHLSNLRTFEMSRISSLRRLPDSISLLSGLHRLTLTHNPHLTALPSSLFALPSLTYLDASHNSLLALPESMPAQTLRHLDLTGNQLVVLPRAFRSLKRHGCELKHDHMEQEHADDDEGQGAVAASSAAPHATKRKKQDDDVADDAEQDARIKHPRSAAQQAADSSVDQPKGVDDGADDAREPEEDEAPLNLSSAAHAIASSTARRATAAPKRKLDADPVRVDQRVSDKRHKMDPALVASLHYFHGELDFGDRITTGFIDAGRRSTLFAHDDDAPTIQLEDIYRLPVNDGEREIVLVDEHRDVRLRHILKQARSMIQQSSPPSVGDRTSPPPPIARSSTESSFTASELQLQVRLLACLVSDSFGGRMVVLSPHHQLQKDQLEAAPPVVMSNTPAAAGASSSSSSSPPAPLTLSSPLPSLAVLCHAEVRWWQQTSQTNVVLLCAIQHGLCRHRAILFKYLLDSIFHSHDVSCRLVRGYREGGVGHAWNVVRIRGGSEFLVDTLDSPHLFRSISSIADPTFAYYPQWATSSSAAFASATTGDLQEQRASFRDLHLARRGRLIGEGSYSQVFECHLPVDAATSRSCALKLTQIAHLTPTQFAALLKEVRLMPHLRHENLVEFFAYRITNESLQVYMELVRGENLDTIIKSLRRQGGRFSADDIVVILSAVARGLQYMHQHSTLHRDVKSAQVLIGYAEADNAGATPFSMPIAASTTSGTHADRTILKVKRKAKTTTDATAATPTAAASASSSSRHPLCLLPRTSDALSFFADARIKLCDLNIAVPVLHPRDDDDAANEQDDSKHIEHVGTLRWMSPESMRAGLPRADATGGEELAERSQDESRDDAPHASPAPPLSPTSRRLRAGQQSDVWSLSCVLFELLTLRLPYENVPTEPELNAKLARGERTDFLQWMDPQYWHETTEEGDGAAASAATTKAEMTGESSSLSAESALRMWQSAVQSSSAPVDSSAPPSTSGLSSSVTYATLVGLFLAGTSPKPTDRPTIDTICSTLEWVARQRQMHHTKHAPHADAEQTAEGSTQENAQKHQSAPGSERLSEMEAATSALAKRDESDRSQTAAASTSSSSAAQS